MIVRWSDRRPLSESVVENQIRVMFWCAESEVRRARSMDFDDDPIGDFAELLSPAILDARQTARAMEGD